MKMDTYLILKAIKSTISATFSNLNTALNSARLISARQFNWLRTGSVKAFSLLEVAISLAIIGVLTMAVLKGQQMLHNARIDKTVNQIEALRINIETFRSTYGTIPGDYNGNAIDIAHKGDGDGVLDHGEEKYFFEHLIAAGLMTQKQSIPAIGGYFNVEYNPQGLIGHWLLLSGPNKSGLLTSKDALTIKLKIDGNEDNTTGIIRISGCTSNGIVQPTKQKTCTLYIEFP